MQISPTSSTHYRVFLNASSLHCALWFWGKVPDMKLQLQLQVSLRCLAVSAASLSVCPSICLSLCLCLSLPLCLPLYQLASLLRSLFSVSLQLQPLTASYCCCRLLKHFSMHITSQWARDREREEERGRQISHGRTSTQTRLPFCLPVAVFVNFNYFLQMMIKLASGSTDIKSISALPLSSLSPSSSSLFVCLFLLLSATALKSCQARIGRQFTGLWFIMPYKLTFCLDIQLC